jgi:hypothetical protein
MKKFLAVCVLSLLFSLVAHAQQDTTNDLGVVYSSTGAWWETKTLPGHIVDAGEIRIDFNDDGTIDGERDYNDEAFDTITGHWAEFKNAAGVVTKVTVTFVSDWAGEIFIGTAKKGVLKGKFSGGGYSGSFQMNFIDPADSQL